MKLYFKSITVSILALSFVATGCLKDKDYNDRKIQSTRPPDDPQKVVELSLTTTSTLNYLNIALPNSTKDTTFDLIPVTLASAQPAKEDIQVTLVPNAALIGDHNASYDTHHEEAPAGLYTLLGAAPAAGGGYVVTIPKGSHMGVMQIKIKPSDYLGFDYALGFQISKIEPAGYQIASNVSTGVVAIGIKNKWDGIYVINGYALRAGDPDLTGNFRGSEMPLVTSGATSVAFGKLAYWGDGVSGIGIGNPNLAINTSGTSPFPVTITSSGGATNAPGYTSRYDEATKTFYVSFTWGAGPAARLATDTLIYDRPRP